MRRLVSIVATTCLALSVAACGSDKEEKKAPASSEAEPGNAAAETAPDPAETASTKTTGQPADKAAPPAEDHGYVVHAGKKTELRGDDFAICETLNPGIKGDFNIIAKLADGTRFRVSGNVDEDNTADHRGLVLGEMPNEVRATNLKVELEGRTLSGTAETDAGPIEFSFEC